MATHRIQAVTQAFQQLTAVALEPLTKGRHDRQRPLVVFQALLEREYAQRFIAGYCCVPDYLGMVAGQLIMMQEQLARRINPRCVLMLDLLCDTRWQRAAL